MLRSAPGWSNADALYSVKAALDPGQHGAERRRILELFYCLARPTTRAVRHLRTAGHSAARALNAMPAAAVSGLLRWCAASEQMRNGSFALLRHRTAGRGPVGSILITTQRFISASSLLCAFLLVFSAARPASRTIKSILRG